MKIRYDVLGTRQFREAYIAVLPHCGDTVWFEDETGGHTYEVKRVFIEMFKEPPERDTVVAELRVVEV